MASYLQMIQSSRDNFTKSYRLLADYIETHTGEIAFISIQELSSRTKVSTTTIHRFCQEIGLNGYAEFQKEIQQEIRDKYNDESSQIDASDNPTSIFNAQVNRNIQVLQELLANEAAINDGLTRAAKMLIQARRIYIIGLEGDFASAQSTYYDFIKLFDCVTMLSLGAGNYLDQLRTIDSNDLLYVISFRIYNRHILDVVNSFLKASAKIIVLADEGSPFSAFSTLALIPKHTTPSYGSVIKVTMQRSLLLTIIKIMREGRSDKDMEYLDMGGLGIASIGEEQ